MTFIRFLVSSKCFLEIYRSSEVSALVAFLLEKKSIPDMSDSVGGKGGGPRFVDHTYREFSRYLQHVSQVDRHKKAEANFPAKLHQMLSDPHFAHVIVWMVRYCYRLGRFGISCSCLVSNEISYLLVLINCPIRSISLLPSATRESLEDCGQRTPRLQDTQVLRS